MKPRPSKHVRFFCLLGLAAWGATPRTEAQTPAGLDIQLYAGLTITGTVGNVYSVEYVTDVAQTNNASAWRCLGFLQLPASPHLWTDRSSQATDKRFYRAVAFAAPTNLVFIPPGTFRMGSPTNEVRRGAWEGPQTAVTISRGFWMGRHEVTQEDYLAVMGTNPSYFNGDRRAEGGEDYGSDLSRPVESVSWREATNYCGQLTERDRASGRIPSNSGYRLPTEAEWEYACRAWTSTRFSFGDDPGYADVSRYAWYDLNSDRRTHAVGQKLPNSWGLYDMHGNVWEWCQDGWSESLPGGLVLDPQTPTAGPYRVIRGGFWFSYARDCRSAWRFRGGSLSSATSVGFRVLLAAGQP